MNIRTADRVTFTLHGIPLTGTVRSTYGGLADVACDIPEGATYTGHTVTVRLERLNSKGPNNG